MTSVLFMFSPLIEQPRFSNGAGDYTAARNGNNLSVIITQEIWNVSINKINLNKNNLF